MEHFAELFDGQFAFFVKGDQSLSLLNRKRGWASAQASSGSGGGQTGESAFPDQIAFELGEGGEEMKDQFPRRGGSIYGFMEAFERDAFGFEESDPFEKIRQGSAQAVETPNDQGIAFSERLFHLGQARSFFEQATDLVAEELLTACGLELIDLRLEVLFQCGNAGVAEEHKY